MTKPTPLTAPDPAWLLSAALARAANGHPVFPCVPGTKRPLTRHGLLDATTDPDLIRAWWRRAPTANLAVPTGTASYDVLDVDLHPTGSGYPSLTRLARAGLADGHSHLIITPSGGMHVYFTGTDQPSSRLPGVHLDFKATGGYVLVPPSVVNGQPYELLHRTSGPHLPLNWAAVRDFLTPHQFPSAPAGQHPEFTLEHLAHWVARLPEGQRNTGTFWAACRALDNGHTDLQPLIDAAVAAGLPPSEAIRTINSAIRHVRRTSA
jgi:hypothetical protein